MAERNSPLKALSEFRQNERARDAEDKARDLAILESLDELIASAATEQDVIKLRGHLHEFRVRVLTVIHKTAQPTT